MPIQLIYRSRALCSFDSKDLMHFASRLEGRNRLLEISGLLLFDGRYFLQLLEGEEVVIDNLYKKIGRDSRHTDLVLLLRDPIPHTHFCNFQMSAMDVRELQGLSGRNAWSLLGSSLGIAWNRDHRSERIIEAFARGRWRDPTSAVAWSIDGETEVETYPSEPVWIGTKPLADNIPVNFAFQPIVHAKERRITSVEALLRGPNGESPYAVLKALQGNQLYEYDLTSKGSAIALASALHIDCVLSVNLLPMSLVFNEGAVDYLLQECDKNKWPRERFLVEITEEEAITHFDEFIVAVRKLRAAGIQVAIDDFGAGHAGLSLLADFQPDKLKIDKRIIQGVCANGARQAIVRSVVEFCFCLGITVVAEGVEAVEDWRWLQAAGIRRFQGYLFARASLNSVTAVTWPQ